MITPTRSPGAGVGAPPGASSTVISPSSSWVTLSAAGGSWIVKAEEMVLTPMGDV